MSLTTLLKNPQIRELFRDTFPFEKPRLDGNLTAVPVTKNYSLVGTAFDYLLRFRLEREYPSYNTRKWIAEGVPELISEQMPDIGKSMSLHIRTARAMHDDYINSGDMTDDLIKTTVILAQIDVVYRAGVVVKSFETVNEGDMRDLKKLVSMVDVKIFKPEQKGFLNPTFGYGSHLVSGADADIIVDDMLIDIKTTKKMDFTRDYFNQLVGYYVLSRLGMVNTDMDVVDDDDEYDGSKGLAVTLPGGRKAAFNITGSITDIEKIGIYFSRYGKLYTMPVEPIRENPRFAEFVCEFERIAMKVFQSEKLLPFIKALRRTDTDV